VDNRASRRPSAIIATSFRAQGLQREARNGFYDDDDESMDSELDPENIHLPLQREIFDEVIKRIKSELRFAKTKNGFQTYYVYEPPEAAKKKSVATRKLIVIRLIIYLINI
jgi:hypothetical protein